MVQEPQSWLTISTFTKRSILNFILHVLSTFPAYYESNINATITLNDIFGMKIINETENYNHLNYIIIGEALHPKTALSSKQCGACKRCVMYSQASAKQSPLRVWDLMRPKARVY